MRLDGKPASAQNAMGILSQITVENLDLAFIYLGNFILSSSAW
jgi:hypothetical protein